MKTASRTWLRILSTLNTASVEVAQAQQQRLRLKTIDEIISTETSYLKHLNIIIKYFIEPLRHRCLASGKEIQIMFGPIESIVNVNKELLTRCEINRQHIAHVFVELAPFLKTYFAYANGYEQASQLLSRVLEQNDSELAKFIKQQETRPEVGMKLNALLIMPIQRVPRYKLLLEELLQHTPCECEEYKVLLEAIHKVSDVTEKINEWLIERDNTQHMLRIQRRLTKGRPRIVVPGRYFVKEGVLRKVSRDGQTSQRRIFILLNDMLMYCKPRGEMLDCCFLTPLKHVRLETLFDVGDSKQGVLFKLTCGQEELLVLTNNVEEGESWVKAINSTVALLNGQRQTLRKESSKNRPLRRKGLKMQHRPLSLSQLSHKRHLEARVNHQDSKQPKVNKRRAKRLMDCLRSSHGHFRGLQAGVSITTTLVDKRKIRRLSAITCAVYVRIKEELVRLTSPTKPFY